MTLSDFLDTAGNQLVSWHAESPDIDLIENAWATLKRNFREQSTCPVTKDVLF